jgi:UDP-3-O-[3-hydroxymyristoyl] glucosamine N-acyltransferase
VPLIMHKTLNEIAHLIGGTLVGDGTVVIKGIAGIREAEEGDITFLANPKYYPLIKSTHASAIIIPADVECGSKPAVCVDNPSLAFTTLISLMKPQAAVRLEGVHPTAVLGKDVRLGPGVAIGPHVVVEDNVTIGEKSVIYPGVFIGHHSAIGSDTLIYSNVSVREYAVIGSRCIIHCGAVIGSDGFGFVTVKGEHHKIPQVGTVEIGDDVEIGANVTIDRARFNKTVIGKGTKIDNLVQIAHNVLIGEHSIIVAQVGISGSTSIGNHVTIAGQVGIVGHISIADEAIITAQSGVSKSVPAGAMMSGTPAKPADVYRKVNACVQNLPRLYEDIAKLKKKIAELEVPSQG